MMIIVYVIASCFRPTIKARSSCSEAESYWSADRVNALFRRVSAWENGLSTIDHRSVLGLIVHKLPEYGWDGRRMKLSDLGSFMRMRHAINRHIDI